jgi:hypothetical protein
VICSFNFLICLAVCLNISTVINIKILTNSNQQTQSYKFSSRIAAFLSVVLITEMLDICMQTSYDQSVQLILKSYLPVVYGTPLREFCKYERGHQIRSCTSMKNSQYNCYDKRKKWEERFEDNKEVTRRHTSMEDRQHN